MGVTMIPALDCSRVVISVDPGLWDSGVAVWVRLDNNKCVLHWAGLVTLSKKTPREKAPRIMAERIFQTVFECSPRAIFEWVIEYPQHYTAKRKTAEGVQTVIDVAEHLSARVRGTTLAGETAAMVRPSQWKGQLPKHIHHDRINQAITKKEVNRIDWPAPHLVHNVWDAVGIGLFYTKRHRRGGITPTQAKGTPCPDL